MIDDLFWPEKQLTPPEELEAKVAAVKQTLAIWKEKIAASSDICLPKLDDSDLLRSLRACKYDPETGFELLKNIYNLRDKDLYVTNSAASKLVVAMKEKSTPYWPEIWTTPPEEIDEKLAMIQRELRLLKEMIACEPRFFLPTDDDTCLLRFLRAKKYDHKRTFALIQNYFRKRATHAHLFQNYLPSLMLKTISELEILSFSPCLDPQGRIVFIIRIGKWDPETTSFEEVVRAYFMTSEMGSFQPFVQNGGVAVIVDLKGFSLLHLLKYSPLLLLTLLETLLKSFPLKIKSINVVNNHAVVNGIYAMIKPFFSPKIQSRVHFHKTKWEALHKQIPPEALPEDYGGYLKTATMGDTVALTLQEEPLFCELQRCGYTS